MDRALLKPLKSLSRRCAHRVYRWSTLFGLFFAFNLAWYLFLPFFQPYIGTPARAADDPQVLARAAIAIDMADGRIVYHKNEHAHLAMASTTKIMTAIVALRYGKIDQTTTVVQDDLVGEASMGLRSGEEITLENLLYGLLMPSGNDAAMAIARMIGNNFPGSKPPVERFVDQMNNTAHELGLKDTHFVTPHGLDADGHYSSANDLAVMGWAAMQYPLISQIVNTRFYNAGGHNISNIDEWLTRYPGSFGIKPGLTDNAGPCLVAGAAKDGRRVIVVVLNSVHMYDDGKRLSDYSFDTLKNDDTSAPRLALPDGATIVRLKDAQIAPDAVQPLTQDKGTGVSSPLPVIGANGQPIYTGEDSGFFTRLFNGDTGALSLFGMIILTLACFLFVASNYRRSYRLLELSILWSGRQVYGITRNNRQLRSNGPEYRGRVTGTPPVKLLGAPGNRHPAANADEMTTAMMHPIARVQSEDAAEPLLTKGRAPQQKQPGKDNGNSSASRALQELHEQLFMDSEASVEKKNEKFNILGQMSAERILREEPVLYQVNIREAEPAQRQSVTSRQEKGYALPNLPRRNLKPTQPVPPESTRVAPRAPVKERDRSNERGPGREGVMRREPPAHRNEPPTIHDYALQGIVAASSDGESESIDCFVRVIRHEAFYDFSLVPGFSEMPATGYASLAAAYITCGYNRAALAALDAGLSFFPGDRRLRMLSNSVAS